FRGLRVRERLRECFEHRSEGLMVGFPSVLLILIVHLMLGFRRLRDIERYRDDPVVLRAWGLRRMPNVCRTLCRADGASVRMFGRCPESMCPHAWRRSGFRE